MTTQEKSRQGFWQSLFGRDEGQEPRETVAEPVVEAQQPQEAGSELEIAPNDPIVAYFLSASGAVEIEQLDLDSPALRAMKAAGIKAGRAAGQPGRADRAAQPGAAPQPAGVLGRRPELSEQPGDPGRPGRAGRPAGAPAAAEARERERIEQELRVARLIQQTLLPKEVPALPGWRLAAYYQPAREVGGDFYDFIDLATAASASSSAT